MLKLQTKVDVLPSSVKISPEDGVVVLGSCFADSVGERMSHGGFDVCVNPFGTLYNPLSLASAISRLDSCDPFSHDDCVMMGAGAGLICSFSHHTSFARADEAAFLDNANAELKKASTAWRKAAKVVLTLGTAWCFRHEESGVVVSNCLKRPASEFRRFSMSVESVSDTLNGILSAHPEKEFIFTVSPIRHLTDGAHGNQLSKSTLILGVESVLRSGVVYFPAYEIFMDELRDYRFYAEDMVHPTEVAENYIWERFCEFAVPPEKMSAVIASTKAWRSSRHRPILISSTNNSH